MLIVDNVIREGAVIEAESTDASVRGTRKLFDLMAANPRLDATALQTVGSKGYDGFVSGGGARVAVSSGGWWGR